MKKLAFPLLILFSITTIIVLQFGFIFLLLALLPSLVAYYVDGDTNRPAFKIVLSCNIAALLPSLSTMFRSLMQLKHYDVSPLMADSSVWLFIYSGAAAGWCMIFLFRYLARFIVSMLYQFNIVSLENLQKQLIEEWGQQISKPPGH